MESMAFFAASPVMAADVQGCWIWTACNTLPNGPSSSLPEPGNRSTSRHPFGGRQGSRGRLLRRSPSFIGELWTCGCTCTIAGYSLKRAKRTAMRTPKWSSQERVNTGCSDSSEPAQCSMLTIITYTTVPDNPPPRHTSTLTSSQDVLAKGQLSTP